MDEKKKENIIKIIKIVIIIAIIIYAIVITHFYLMYKQIAENNSKDALENEEKFYNTSKRVNELEKELEEYKNK